MAGLLILFKVSGLSLFVMLIMMITSLAIGNILGEIDSQNHSNFVISSIARNVGLALLITVIHNLEKEVISTLIVFVLIRLIFSVIYLIWYKKD